MNLLLKLAALLAAGYVFASIALYLLQTQLIFYPQPPGPDPSSEGVHPAREVQRLPPRTPRCLFL